MNSNLTFDIISDWLTIIINQSEPFKLWRNSFTTHLFSIKEAYFLFVIIILNPAQLVYLSNKPTIYSRYSFIIFTNTRIRLLHGSRLVGPTPGILDLSLVDWIFSAAAKNLSTFWQYRGIVSAARVATIAYFQTASSDGFSKDILDTGFNFHGQS